MMKCVASCLLAVLFVIETRADGDPEPLTAEIAYERLLLAEHWRERGEAARQLEAFGEQVLPYLIRGTKHGWEEIRENCYQSLLEKFPDREETEQAVVRGLGPIRKPDDTLEPEA